MLGRVDRINTLPPESEWRICGHYKLRPFGGRALTATTLAQKKRLPRITSSSAQAGILSGVQGAHTGKRVWPE